jgi:putative toxin-antitoxin system antitoxin component (TIGR02293 family)
MLKTRRKSPRRSVAPASQARGRGASLGLLDSDTASLVRQVKEGLPYAAMLRFQKNTGISLSTTASLIQIPPRTLLRRKAAGRLRPDESERLLRIAGVFENAAELFDGDTEKARRWLSIPARSLEGQTPLEFAQTEIGAREVENLIGRLEHGVFT